MQFDNPNAQQFYTLLMERQAQVDAFDEQDDAVSGSKRVLNRELVEKVEKDQTIVEMANEVLAFLNNLDPLVRAGAVLLLNRNYDNSEAGKQASSEVEAILAERKKAAEAAGEQAGPSEADLEVRNNLIVEMDAYLTLIKQLGGPEGATFVESFKLPRKKSSTTRTPSGPRLKGSFQFYYAGKLQATKLSELSTRTKLKSLDLKQRMASAAGVDYNDKDAFAAFLADPPNRVTFNITVGDGDSARTVEVEAIQETSDDEPELVENSEDGNI